VDAEVEIMEPHQSQWMVAMLSLMRAWDDSLMSMVCARISWWETAPMSSSSELLMMPLWFTAVTRLPQMDAGKEYCHSRTSVVIL